MRLRIAEDLSLPIEAVTEKLGFLGRTGSGKTYAAQKLAEEMHRAGAQFIALSPTPTDVGKREEATRTALAAWAEAYRALSGGKTAAEANALELAYNGASEKLYEAALAAQERG